MVNILFINPAGFIGGAEKSLLDLVTHLPPDRFQPLVVLLSPGPLEEELQARGIPSAVVPLPPALLRLSRGKNFRSFFMMAAVPFLTLPVLKRICRLIRAENITVIHTNGLKAHLLGVALSLITGRPLVWHFRDLLDEGIYARLFRWLARVFPRKIIANSKKVKERLGDLEKTNVVYNAIDPPRPGKDEDRRQRRTALGLSEEDITIGTVGHFAPLKGYEDFVRAMPTILQKIPRARFLIVGEAIYPAYRDYKQQIGDLVDRLGLSGKVNFTGFRDDLREVLDILDIFVLPSRSEGFGRANLEAMAAGKPVVSTNVGGIPEVVINGEDGILVPPCDPGALAAAIIRLAEDKALAGKMGAAGRKRAEQFTIEKMVDGVVRVYEEIINTL